jgi:hypothetical protein
VEEEEEEEEGEGEEGGGGEEEIVVVVVVVQVTDGRRYFPGGPHVDQRWSKAYLRLQHQSTFLSKSFLI